MGVSEDSRLITERSYVGKISVLDYDVEKALLDSQSTRQCGQAPIALLHLRTPIRLCQERAGSIYTLLHLRRHLDATSGSRTSSLVVKEGIPGARYSINTEYCLD